MSYATLMVYVNADRVSKQLVSVAAGIPDKFSTKLIGVSALAIMPPFVGEGVVIVDNATEFDIEKMKAKLAADENKFRACAGADRQIEWRSVLEFPTQTLMSEARCADLIVVEKGKSDDIYRTLDTGAAILGTGRPFLVVPAAVKSLAADHVVVGWKDTREARRAVQDALPFLQEAMRVTIVEACGADEEKTALAHLDDVTRYLTRHRIKGGPRVMLEQKGSGAAQLIRIAQEERADLLVTGAYGHSRLGEWVFGGMTRDLLATSPICCLMSH